MHLLSRWSSCVLLLAAGLLAAQPSLAQFTTPPAASQLSLGPAVRVDRLPNALTYYIRRNTLPAHDAKLMLANRVGHLTYDEQEINKDKISN